MTIIRLKNWSSPTLTAIAALLLFSQPLFANAEFNEWYCAPDSEVGGDLDSIDRFIDTEVSGRQPESSSDAFRLPDLSAPEHESANAAYQVIKAQYDSQFAAVTEEQGLFAMRERGIPSPAFSDFILSLEPHIQHRVLSAVREGPVRGETEEQFTARVQSVYQRGLKEMFEAGEYMKAALAYHHEHRGVLSDLSSPEFLAIYNGSLRSVNTAGSNPKHWTASGIPAETLIQIWKMRELELAMKEVSAYLDENPNATYEELLALNFQKLDFVQEGDILSALQDKNMAAFSGSIDTAAAEYFQSERNLFRNEVTDAPPLARLIREWEPRGFSEADTRALWNAARRVHAYADFQKYFEAHRDSITLEQIVDRGYLKIPGIQDMRIEDPSERRAKAKQQLVELWVQPFMEEYEAELTDLLEEEGVYTRLPGELELEGFYSNSEEHLAEYGEVYAASSTRYTEKRDAILSQIEGLHRRIFSKLPPGDFPTPEDVKRNTARKLQLTRLDYLLDPTNAGFRHLVEEPGGHALDWDKIRDLGIFDLLNHSDLEPELAAYQIEVVRERGEGENSENAGKISEATLQKYLQTRIYYSALQNIQADANRRILGSAAEFGERMLAADLEGELAELDINSNPLTETNYDETISLELDRVASRVEKLNEDIPLNFGIEPAAVRQAYLDSFIPMAQRGAARKWISDHVDTEWTSVLSSARERGYSNVFGNEAQIADIYLTALIEKMNEDADASGRNEAGLEYFRSLPEEAKQVLAQVGFNLESGDLDIDKVAGDMMLALNQYYSFAGFSTVVHPSGLVETQQFGAPYLGSPPALAAEYKRLGARAFFERYRNANYGVLNPHLEGTLNSLSSMSLFDTRTDEERALEAAQSAARFHGTSLDGSIPTNFDGSPVAHRLSNGLEVMVPHQFRGHEDLIPEQIFGEKISQNEFNKRRAWATEQLISLRESQPQYYDKYSIFLTRSYKPENLEGEEVHLIDPVEFFLEGQTRRAAETQVLTGFLGASLNGALGDEAGSITPFVPGIILHDDSPEKVAERARADWQKWEARLDEVDYFKRQDPEASKGRREFARFLHLLSQVYSAGGPAAQYQAAMAASGRLNATGSVFRDTVVTRRESEAQSKAQNFVMDDISFTNRQLQLLAQEYEDIINGDELNQMVNARGSYILAYNDVYERELEDFNAYVEQMEEREKTGTFGTDTIADIWLRHSLDRFSSFLVETSVGIGAPVKGGLFQIGDNFNKWVLGNETHYGVDAFDDYRQLGADLNASAWNDEFLDGTYLPTSTREMLLTRRGLWGMTKANLHGQPVLRIGGVIEPILGSVYDVYDYGILQGIHGYDRDELNRMRMEGDNSGFVLTTDAAVGTLLVAGAVVQMIRTADAKGLADRGASILDGKAARLLRLNTRRAGVYKRATGIYGGQLTAGARTKGVSGFLFKGNQALRGGEVGNRLANRLSNTGQLATAGTALGAAVVVGGGMSMGHEIYYADLNGEDFDLGRAIRQSWTSTGQSMLFMAGISSAANMITKSKMGSAGSKPLAAMSPAEQLQFQKAQMSGQRFSKSFDVFEGLSDMPSSIGMLEEAINAKSGKRFAAALSVIGFNAYDTFDLSVTNSVRNIPGASRGLYSTVRHPIQTFNSSRYQLGDRLPGSIPGLRRPIIEQTHDEENNDDGDDDPTPPSSPTPPSGGGGGSGGASGGNFGGGISGPGIPGSGSSSGAPIRVDNIDTDPNAGITDFSIPIPPFSDVGSSTSETGTQVSRPETTVVTAGGNTLRLVRTREDADLPAPVDNSGLVIIQPPSEATGSEDVSGDN